MTDVKQELRRARQLAPVPADAFERLVERRGRSVRRRRVGTAVVALGLAGASVAGIASLVGNEGGSLGGGREWSTPTPSETGGPSSAPAFDPTAYALADGDFYYQHVVVLFSGERAEQETWWGRDGSGRRRLLVDSTNYGQGPEGVFGPGEFKYIESDLSDLPPDPEGFLAALIERSGDDGRSPQAPYTPDPGGDPFGGELWRAVERLVELPDFTADLRATLFEVVMALPGAEVTEGAVDPVGRSATLIAVQFGDIGVYRLYFDPDTRQVLAAGNGWTDGGEFLEIWLASGNVASTDEVPSGGNSLIPEPVEPLPTT